ncbi:YfbU domain [[Clostridium] sordellii]|uniref:YfbU family protein n=1 Tax=Paraclostridium sordellii TaxID=1505 RepID=UPI0005E353DC|nr:YfbU family protein [Paeniclostridium sordellii]CEP90228.1 YfbU domain [[Clostridium] sordellii] [Paeniclostridium sordellii]
MENKGEIKLSKLERLVLSNQYRILERLYPEEADYYEVNRKAIESGFELHYEDCFSSLSDSVLTSKECEEVLDILSMYSAITFSDRDNEVEEYYVKFRGFDLNDEYEGKRVMYARYFINDLDRFTELKYGNIYVDCNSHTKTMEKYRRMLSVWKSMDDQNNLNKEEILKIVNA